MFCDTHNISHNIYPNIPHTQFEYEEYMEILCGILLVPSNIVMDLNNVMFGIRPNLNALVSLGGHTLATSNKYVNV